MADRFYSVEELAGILKLHPKTVLRFIREGRIAARKLGRSWRVSREALEAYAHAEFASGPGPEGPVDLAAAARRARVSAVVEIDAEDSAEASRLSNTLMAALNCKDPAWGESRFDFLYFPELRKAKYALYGTPRFIAEIMAMLDRLGATEGGGT